MLTELERSAFHEAGHAVAAYRGRECIRERVVTIVPNADHVGSFHARSTEILLRKVCPPNTPAYHAWLARTENEIVELLAGSVAEWRAQGRISVDASITTASTDPANDVNRVRELIDALGFDVQDYLPWMVQRTRCILQNRQTWSAVKEIAALLIQNRFVDGAQVVAICQARRVPVVPLSNPDPSTAVEPRNEA